MQATLGDGVRELSRDGGRHDNHSPIVGVTRRPESLAQVDESLLHELAIDRVRSRGPDGGRSPLSRSPNGGRSVGPRPILVFHATKTATVC